MSFRVTHPAQGGTRLSPLDSLFEQVEPIRLPQVPVEAIPVPEVIELHAPVLTEVVVQGRAAP